MSPDLLDHVQVTVPCPTCDESYTVPASVVRASQRVLAEGCTGTSSYECEASFYATLIVVRAVGFTDVLPADEPQLRELVRELYGLTELPSPEQLGQLAEPWKPWRTWCAVLVRAAASRVLSLPSGNVRERLTA